MHEKDHVEAVHNDHYLLMPVDNFTKIICKNICANVVDIETIYEFQQNKADISRQQRSFNYIENQCI
jgi:hypothetical protein